MGWLTILSLIFKFTMSVLGYMSSLNSWEHEKFFGGGEEGTGIFFYMHILFVFLDFTLQW